MSEGTVTALVAFAPLRAVAVPRALRALLLQALHSRFARLGTHPLFTVPLFIASLHGVHVTPLSDVLMGSPVGHPLMLAHFVVTGLLFVGAILGRARGRGC